EHRHRIKGDMHRAIEDTEVGLPKVRCQPFGFDQKLGMDKIFRGCCHVRPSCQCKALRAHSVGGGRQPADDRATIPEGGASSRPAEPEPISRRSAAKVWLGSICASSGIAWATPTVASDDTPLPIIRPAGVCTGATAAAPSAADLPLAKDATVPI